MDHEYPCPVCHAEQDKKMRDSGHKNELAGTVDAELEAMSEEGPEVKPILNMELVMGNIPPILFNPHWE